MGQAKNELMEAMDRKWWPTEKFVCTKCLTAPSLQRAIRANLTPDTCCSYCDSSESASVDFLLENQITPAILTYYTQPENELGWADGEWVGTPIDSDDLVDELLAEYDGTDDGDLLNDLKGSITESQWCRCDYYGVQPEDSVFFDWQDFCQLVKHHTRYFFHDIRIGDDAHGYEPIAAGTFLESLRQLLATELLKSVKKGKLIWRGRIDKIRHHNPRELAAPMPERATSSNRMSPAGISMFYGAFDSDTAAQELGAIQNGKVLSIATFSLNQNVKVIDLTKLPCTPDFFDLKAKYRRYSCIFLERFVDDLRKPIVKDGREHLEYIPTQVLTEYLKSTLGADGMVYHSAQHRGGKCIALWNQEFLPDYHGNTNGLELVNVEYIPR